MAHRLAARILTTEKDSEMNQTTNINISYDHKNDMQNHQNVSLTPSESGNVSPRVEARDIELTEDIPDTGQEIEFLETLLQEYQAKPVVVKGLLICKSKNLMNLIKIATQAEKVEIILNENISCTSCTDTKFTYVQSILVTKGGKTTEFKHGYNEIYSKFLKFGINTKIVI